MKHYERELIKELKKSGFKYTDSNDIFQQKQLQPKEIEIILKWLPEIYTEHYGTADTLVRSLIGAAQPFDPALLIDIFETSDLNFSLKSGIAFTLVFAKTADISEWIRDQLLNKDYSLERSALVFGLEKKGGFKSDKELMIFIKKVFDKYHEEITFKLFIKFGDEDDFLFLEKKAKTSDSKLAKTIIKFIDKRNKTSRT